MKDELVLLMDVEVLMGHKFKDEEFLCEPEEKYGNLQKQKIGMNIK